MNSIGLNIADFDSSLTPTACKGVTCSSNYKPAGSKCVCSCSLACDTRKQIFNWGSCGCSYYTDGTRIYEILRNLTILISRVNTHCEDATVINTFLEKIFSSIDSCTGLKSDMENNFDTLDQAAMLIKINEAEANCRKLTSDIDSYLLTLNACPNAKVACSDVSVRINVDCSCFTDEQTKRYRDDFRILQNLTVVIMGYTGKGSGSDIAAFEKRVKDNRKDYELIEKYIREKANTPAYDVNELKALIDAAEKITLKIKEDWDKWYADQNTTVACTLPKCVADQVISKCSCLTIKDYDKMANIPNVCPSEDDINALNISPDLKQKLIDNR